ncbi:hypothetical protein JHK82_027815 [Glycine max]|nr:hypothetical protein JHK82_027815 [Glycine max]
MHSLENFDVAQSLVLFQFNILIKQRVGLPIVNSKGSMLGIRRCKTYVEMLASSNQHQQGPMFGAMMISKQKVAHLALKPLGRNNAIDGTCGVGTKEPQLIFASADIEEIVDD